jgi:hypothetical protein
MKHVQSDSNQVLQLLGRHESVNFVFVADVTL